eukprot:GHVS01065759.1.p3 GENE.GHVS01065759.1~~GHVS01065759.1.p3  ORF type:complete len:123 (-),score=22.72 GHVS01065759.1:501-869(-)
MISVYLSMILSFIFLKILSFSLPTFSSYCPSSDVCLLLLSVPCLLLLCVRCLPGGMKQMLPVGIPSQQPDGTELTTIPGLETNNIHAILLSLISAGFPTSSKAHGILSLIQPTDGLFAWKGT